MVDETLFQNKLDELVKEHSELIEERKNVIESHSAEIDEAIDEATKEFIKENREKIIKEVLGNTLTEIDDKLNRICAIKEVLCSLIVYPEETPSNDSEEIKEEIVE